MPLPGLCRVLTRARRFMRLRISVRRHSLDAMLGTLEE